MSRKTAIVDELLADLTGRRGLKQAWESIRPEIQDEIRKRWEEIVEHELSLPDSDAP